MIWRFLLVLAAVFLVIAGLITSGAIDSGSFLLWQSFGFGAAALAGAATHPRLP